MKVHIKSFGCQMNKLDTNLVCSALKSAGHEITDDISFADVVLLNTCSVREHAEQRVMSHLGNLKNIRQKSKPEMIVVVFGCMAQRIPDELLKHPAVDVVCGPGQIPQIPQLISMAAKTRRPAISVAEDIRSRPADVQIQNLDDFEYENDAAAPALPRQAFVRIMHGCNKFCTYCIVPYVRGPEISRPPETIIRQIKKIASGGVRQITLLGQTVNSYKYTAGDKTYNLADLLAMASEIEGIEWIRFVTGHPNNFGDEIFKAMANLPKVCRYLHIPAQSGSDKILKAMNRGYTRSEYIGLVERARSIVPDIAIAGDLIVGFSGETEKDYFETVELVEQVRYKNCFVFKYSPRPGTRADEKLADDVPDEVKKQRNIHLLEVQKQISQQDNRRFIGQTVKVMVEGTSGKAHLNKAGQDPLPQMIGRTAGDYIVVFNGESCLAGEFVNVKIEKTSALTLFGRMV